MLLLITLDRELREQWSLCNFKGETWVLNTVQNCDTQIVKYLSLYRDLTLRLIIVCADLFYGGETVSLEQQLSYTCPLCGRLGFTDVLLQEHVGVEHTDASQEVVRFDGWTDLSFRQSISNLHLLKTIRFVYMHGGETLTGNVCAHYRKQGVSP